jgi:hypothetical protein
MMPKDEAVVRHCLEYCERWHPDTPILEELPEGWHITKGTLTNPSGMVWVNKGPLYVRDGDGWKGNPDFECALMWDPAYCQ